jgi:uncharacterized protein YggE
MKKIIKIIKGLIIIMTLFAAQTMGQGMMENSPSLIRTNGEGIITIKPDQSRIDIGVVSQANTSQAAVEQNSAQLEAALASLRRVLGANADIKTVSYTLQPNYQYPKEGGEPNITGFTATNIVRVTVNDLNMVGKVIDAATENGANRIQNLRFMLKDEQIVKGQALREAVTKAKEKAETLASALGLKVVRVLSVVESSPSVVPVRDVAFVRTETATTPIESGTIEVRANITLTVEINQQ